MLCTFVVCMQQSQVGPISTCQSFLPSADHLLKQFGPRSGPENVWRGLNLNCLTGHIPEGTFEKKTFKSNLIIKI